MMDCEINCDSKRCLIASGYSENPTQTQDCLLCVGFALLVRFVPHPDSHLYFWVTQDILGTCTDIVFLGLMLQLNTSIQVVASIYLVDCGVLVRYLFRLCDALLFV
jgi:hypothetical protein